MTKRLGWASNCQEEFDQGKKVSVLCKNDDGTLVRVRLKKRNVE